MYEEHRGKLRERRRQVGNDTICDMLDMDIIILIVFGIMKKKSIFLDANRPRHIYLSDVTVSLLVVYSSSEHLFLP